MNILLCGGAGFGNPGDEALLRACAEACSAAVPKARLRYLANIRSIAEQTLAGLDVALFPSPRFSFFRGDPHYGACDEVFLSRWRALHTALVRVPLAKALKRIASSEGLDFIDRSEARQTMLALAGCDALVVHGGGILTSPTRSRLWEQCLTTEMAAGLGKRVLLRSHQLGPYTSASDRARLATMLRLASYVSTRDKEQSSVEALRIMPGARVVDQVDDALLLADAPGIERDTLAAHDLRPRGYLCVGYRHNPSVGIDDSYFEKTAAVVTAAKQAFGSPVVLLPQGASDEPHLARLASLLDFETRLVRPENLLFGTIAVAANARLMVACPHHSLIFALRGTVPILSPVGGDYYRFKNTGSMRLFGLEDFVIDIGEAPEDFMPIVEDRLAVLRQDEEILRATIAQRVGALRTTAAQQDREFARRLTGEHQLTSVCQRLRSASAGWFARRRKGADVGAP
jgi:polysaccharide pyruvyl transferase WcaK-like protein